jgi:hypothetical protein
VPVRANCRQCVHNRHFRSADFLLAFWGQIPPIKRDH